MFHVEHDVPMRQRHLPDSQDLSLQRWGLPKKQLARQVFLLPAVVLARTGPGRGLSLTALLILLPMLKDALGPDMESANPTAALLGREKHKVHPSPVSNPASLVPPGRQALPSAGSSLIPFRNVHH